MKFLHLLWRNLGRKKARTLFTFLSITVAFFLFGLLMAVKNGFEAGIEIAGQNRLLTIHKVSIIQPLPYRYLEQIRTTEGVAAATHASWFGGIYQDPKNFFPQIAVEPAEHLAIYPEYELSEEERREFVRIRTGAIAGRALAERFGWEVGDVYTFDLVGIYDGATPDVDESQFFFHYDYLMERVGDVGLVGWYVVEVEDPEAADRVANAIDERFANSPAETKTTTEKAFMQSFAKQVGDTGTILMAIVGIVFFVILLIAGNTMAQSVRERTNELGVLKTLGFSDRGVLALVLAESVLLTASAGVLGLVAIYLVAPGIRPLVEAFLPVFYVPPRSILYGVGLAVLLGLASGGLPAWLAMRLEIVDALRRR